jgi:hypothetical protein
VLSRQVKGTPPDMTMALAFVGLPDAVMGGSNGASADHAPGPVTESARTP